ncbi:hypothetical protein ACOME3_005751 [Neoechinorhynchus agilis]
MLFIMVIIETVLGLYAPDQPKQLRVQSFNSTSITIGWQSIKLSAVSSEQTDRRQLEWNPHSFIVRYRPSNQQNHWHLLNVTRMDTSHRTHGFYEAVLTDLVPGTRYEIVIIPYYMLNNSYILRPGSNSQTFTAYTEPRKGLNPFLDTGNADAGIQDLNLHSTSPFSINVSWREHLRPSIFKVSWSPTSCPSKQIAICATYEHNVSQSFHIIQDLAPGVSYTVRVSKFDTRSKQFGPPTNGSATTLPKTPPTPYIQSVSRYNASNARVQIAKVINYPRIQYYILHYTEGIVVDQSLSSITRRSIVKKWSSVSALLNMNHNQSRFINVDVGRLDNRLTYTMAVSCRAERSGELIESDISHFYVVDVARELGPVKKYTSRLPSPWNLTVVDGTIRSNSAQLSFRYQDNFYSQLKANYIEIVFEGFQSYIDSLGFPQRYRDAGINNITLRPTFSDSITDDLYIWILSALLPNALYTVNVSAVASQPNTLTETSYPSAVSFHTKYDVPPYIEIPCFLNSDKEKRTASIGLKQASSKNGPIVLYFIVLERFDLAEPYGISSAYSFRDSIDPHQKTVAIFNASTGLPSLFILGNNSSYQEVHQNKHYKYTNGPLDQAGKYRVKLCVQVEDFGSSGDNEPLLIDCSSYSSVFTLFSTPRRRIGSAHRFSTTASFNYSMSWLVAIIILIIVILSIFVILIFQIRRVNSSSVRSYTDENGDYSKQGLLDSKLQAVKKKASFISAPSVNDFQNIPLIKNQSATLILDELSNGTTVSQMKRTSTCPVDLSISTSNPIEMSEFSSVLECLKQNDQFALSQEYDSIDPGQQFTWKFSLLDSNRAKNRYANVTAYDHSRVILQSANLRSPSNDFPEQSDDYINANYIDGFLKPRTYIATQGPLRSTRNDFWRMIWQEKSPAIVMLTKCEERNRHKCDQYWPQRKSQVDTYGDIQVQLVESQDFSSFSLRCLKLIRNDENPHTVLHFQFTAWPDHGVPPQCTTFLMFCQRVRQLTGGIVSAPLVVHCSAGVGRTGCFIVVHNLMLKLECDINTFVSPIIIDICAYVTKIRGQRNYMVQTDQQYAFIYDSISELVQYGGQMNQCVEAKDMFAYVHSLIDNTSQSIVHEHLNNHSISHMELEFKRLACDKASPEKVFTATLESNRFKNRLVNILPFEWNRFVLNPPIRIVSNLTGLAETSDYINASLIDSYERKHAYIAAQGPLTNTITEFWMMIWQSECSIVVMLTKLVEMGKERCAQYWPQQGFAEFSHLRIDSIAHYKLRDYTVSEFKLTHIPEGKTRTIRQFRYEKWPDQGVPGDVTAFLDFIGQIHQTKKQFGLDNDPIVAHCSAGVAQTGIFIAISICIERLKLENVVDVFMAVRMLRSQRVAMVQTEDQYQFCYRAVLQYVGCILGDT